MTKVVHIRKAHYDVYIGRAGRGHDGYFGNPYQRDPRTPLGSTLKRYEIYFYTRLQNDPEFARRVDQLRGKTLGCFCKPGRCHGDIIAEYLDKLSFPIRE